MAASVQAVVDNAKVVFVNDGRPTRANINWYRKDKRSGEWVRSSATLIIFGDAPEIAKGDRVSVGSGNLLCEESDTWKMGKPGDKDSIRPAIFPAILCDGASVTVHPGEREHANKRASKSASSAASSKRAPKAQEEEDLPF